MIVAGAILPSSRCRKCGMRLYPRESITAHKAWHRAQAMGTVRAWCRPGQDEYQRSLYRPATTACPRHRRAKGAMTMGESENLRERALSLETLGVCPTGEHVNHPQCGYLGCVDLRPYGFNGSRRFQPHIAWRSCRLDVSSSYGPLCLGKCPQQKVHSALSHL